MLKKNIKQKCKKIVLSKRSIRSFVIRNKYLNNKQQTAIDLYWDKTIILFQNNYLNFVELFSKKAPVILEIGFGNGTSLIDMAKKNSHINFLGIEVYLPGIGNCLHAICQEKVKNLKIIYHDAIEVIEKMIPNNSLHCVQLFFPDPWKKKSHKKRRILQRSFINIVLKKLEINGKIHVITDFDEYAEFILNIFDELKDYKIYSTNNLYNILNEKVNTKFSERAQKLNYYISNIILKKI
ncbi:tRNA (guanosine(46)-N7)-methyltransferase TrmB [Candidatus Tachikawaea gelatinosa]|uniref:tRNA (guanine-N(7)-)-methyltransferase n=1 Tax=Candidatus Tachikawaea gelatinosa TaxID=1410383 RepID=A0A090AQP1_9ENTR|nr:tRNA (guanosine(46)-N7)-methyltransferase TrmB [Candidatus Tachikawaea gelatinosa]BAP58662.1 tRNA (guanine-N(7)-)-methyltransferase [Candidatus Tachikawaea gelatinosa]